MQKWKVVLNKDSYNWWWWLFKTVCMTMYVSAAFISTVFLHLLLCKTWRAKQVKSNELLLDWTGTLQPHWSFLCFRLEIPTDFCFSELSLFSVPLTKLNLSECCTDIISTDVANQFQGPHLNETGFWTFSHLDEDPETGLPHECQVLFETV